MRYNSPSPTPSRYLKLDYAFHIPTSAVKHNPSLWYLPNLPRWLSSTSSRSFTISRQICFAVRSDAVDAAALPPSEITILIKESNDYTSLSAVVDYHGPYFNSIHAAAAFTHAAQLAQQLTMQSPQFNTLHQQQQQGVKSSTNEPKQRAMQQQQKATNVLLQLLPKLMQILQQHCSSLQGRQTANCMWSVSKLLHTLDQQQQQDGSSDAIQELVQQLSLLQRQLIQHSEQCWHLFNSQELVLLLYAAANMPVRMSPPQLQGPSPAAAASAAASVSAYEVSIAWINTAVSQLQKQHRGKKLRLKPQEFQMLLNSLRLLQQQQQQQQQRDWDPSTASTYTQQEQQQQQQQQQQQEDVQVRVPVSLLQALLTAAADQSRRCSSRDIAGILYSFTALNLKPSSSSSIARLLSPLCNSKKLQSCNAVDVTNILYALAATGFKLQQQQQQQQQQGAGSATAAIKGLVRVLLQQQHQQFTAAELAVCLYSLGRLRLRPPAAAVAAVATAAVEGLQPHQQRELALVGWSLGALRIRTQPPLLQTVLDKYLQTAAATDPAAALQHASSPSAPHVPSSTVAATAELQPEQQQQQQQQLRLTAQHTSMMIWSLGRLQYIPPLSLLLPLLQLSHRMFTYSSPQHLACMCYGLGRSGLRPSTAWLLGFYERVVQLCHNHNHKQQQQQGQHVGGYDDDHVMPPEHADQPRDERDVGRSGDSSTGFGSNQVSEGCSAFTGQQLAMVVWGLAQLQVQSLDSTPAAAPADSYPAEESRGSEAVMSVTGMLQNVLGLSQSMLQASPVSVGIILWGCVKLGYKPETQVVKAALRAFLRHQQQQNKQGNKGRSGCQQQQRRVVLPVQQQQQRYAQSLALSVWSLAKFDSLDDDQKQLLMQVLWANIQQLQYFTPVELTTIIWGLNKLQLTPPTPWLLNFYISSQLQLDNFTDVRLASLTVPLYELLKQSQQVNDNREGGITEQQALQVPPAVWQLQLELQLQQRRRRYRRRRVFEQQYMVPEDSDDAMNEGGVADDGAESEMSDVHGDKRRNAESLRVVSSILQRWRSVGVGSSATAASKQLIVQEEPVLV